MSLVDTIPARSLLVCDGVGVVVQVPFRKAVLLGKQTNTAINGSGKIAPVIEAGPRGAVVEGVQLKAAENTSASNMIRIYLGDGNTWGLFDEIKVTEISASATVKSWGYFWQPECGPITLPPGARLGMSTQVDDDIYAHPEGGHL